MKKKNRLESNDPQESQLLSEPTNDPAGEKQIGKEAKIGIAIVGALLVTLAVVIVIKFGSSEKLPEANVNFEKNQNDTSNKKPTVVRGVGDPTGSQNHSPPPSLPYESKYSSQGSSSTDRPPFNPTLMPRQDQKTSQDSHNRSPYDDINTHVPPAANLYDSSHHDHAKDSPYSEIGKSGVAVSDGAVLQDTMLKEEDSYTAARTATPNPPTAGHIVNGHTHSPAHSAANDAVVEEHFASDATPAKEIGGSAIVLQNDTIAQIDRPGDVDITGVLRPSKPQGNDYDRWATRPDSAKSRSENELQPAERPLRNDLASNVRPEEKDQPIHIRPRNDDSTPTGALTDYQSGGSTDAEVPRRIVSAPYTSRNTRQRTPRDTSDSRFATSPVKKPIASRPTDGQYTVQPNDSYWKISEKVYGTGGFFKALIEFNRKPNTRPDQLKIGQLINVPKMSDLRSRYPSLCPKVRQRSVADVTSLNTRSYGPTRVYVVQEGDTLFDIAKYELGKPTRWTEIFQLNRDKLADFNFVKPGTRLILPVNARAREDRLTRDPKEDGTLRK